MCVTKITKDMSFKKRTRNIFCYVSFYNIFNKESCKSSVNNFSPCQLYVVVLLSCDIFDISNDLSDTNLCSCIKVMKEKLREREREMVGT